MFNVTNIYAAASELLYEFNVLKHGISKSPALAAASVGALAVGNTASVIFALNAITAESRGAKIGYGLMTAGSFALTMYAGHLSLESFLRNGCVEIIKEFGNCIPSYSPCHKLFCTLTLYTIKL